MGAMEGWPPRGGGPQAYGVPGVVVQMQALAKQVQARRQAWRRAVRAPGAGRGRGESAGAIVVRLCVSVTMTFERLIRSCEPPGTGGQGAAQPWLCHHPRRTTPCTDSPHAPHRRLRPNSNVNCSHTHTDTRTPRHPMLPIQAGYAAPGLACDCQRPLLGRPCLSSLPPRPLPCRTHTSVCARPLPPPWPMPNAPGPGRRSARSPPARGRA